MRNFEKFTEKLPSQENFYSLVTGKQISDKEYEHVLKVWNKFEVKPRKGYQKFYFKCDVLLFANLFKKLRNNTWEIYEFCPSHYLTALIWDAILNMIKVELITDPEMYIFFEKI